MNSPAENRGENGVRHPDHVSGGNAMSELASESMELSPSPPSKRMNGDHGQPEDSFSNAIPSWHKVLWQDWSSDPEVVAAPATLASAEESRDHVYQCTFGVPAAFEKLEFFLILWMLDAVISTVFLVPLRLLLLFMKKFKTDTFDLLQVGQSIRAYVPARACVLEKDVLFWLRCCE